MNAARPTPKASSRASASWTPLDAVLAACGPLAILTIWALLPPAVPEGSRTADVPATGVIAELVGYSLASAGRDAPAVLGRGEEADFRLHEAPIARRAAVVLPRRDGRAVLSLLPAATGLTLRRVPPGPVEEENAAAVVTSFRPWAEADGTPETLAVGCESPEATIAPVRLRQLRLWGLPGDGLAEPEVKWLEAGGRAAVAGGAASVEAVACPGGRVWWKERGAPAAADPCPVKAEGWKRVRICWAGRPAVCLEPWSRAWGVRIGNGKELVTRMPWGEDYLQVSSSAPEGHLRGGLGVTHAGLELASIRVGLDASPCGGAGCDPRPRPVCRAGGGEPLAVLGPLDLGDGDVVGIGRTRFLVRAGGTAGPELLHVRDPRAPGFFSSLAGHEAYHPNRRATWPVPSCEDGRDALTLTVRPREAEAGGVSAADLPARDRERMARIGAAARHYGVPHELPAVSGRLRGERALASLCAAEDGDGRLRAVLAADSPRGFPLRTREREEVLRQGEIEVPLGTWLEPEEALVDLDGNLIRIAPAAGVRLTRRLRLGLAGYLVFVLTLQAVPLSRARAGLRRPLGALQQLAGTAIVVLLFLGGNFQGLLALHPELAGKADYVEAFLLGVVAVSTLLAACAGFALGRARLPERCASAALAAALALFGAAVWHAWDGRGVPAGLWLTALRNQAVASAGAGPADFGRLLLQAGGAALALALAFRVSGALPWPSWTEWIARRALRAPAVGFAGLAACGLALGLAERSALAFELAILAGLAWYAGVYWAFVRRGRLPREDRLQRRAAVLSLGSGLVMLSFLVAFFLVGSELPDALSFLCVVLGLGLAGAAARIMVAERFTSLLRVLFSWGAATVFGCAFASLVLTDMGSVAAWVPALLAGLFLWLVRPEEQGSRLEEPRKALSQLLLAAGLGLVLLGLLDVVKTVAQGLEWQALDRPRQRLDLAEDVSYITAGEWITEVRWLASHQDGELRWVPNVNSDVAVFGLAAGLGPGLAVAASVLVLAVAGCAAFAAEAALREGHAAARSGSDRLAPALWRSLGLLSGMAAVLLVAQWLVHLSTGVVLHLPITGLVFPWVSHGNTTHLLYAAAMVAPMAAAAATAASTAAGATLGGRPRGTT